MRVTDRMMFENAVKNTQAARQKLEEANREVSSGQRLNHPGDDPGAAALIGTHRQAAERFDAIKQVAERAASEINATESALNGVVNSLTRAKELAVQMANGTYSATNRADTANEVDALFAQVIAEFNTQMGDRYIFGGFQTGAPPFDGTGAYLGDDGVRQVEVAPGVFEDVSIRGDVTAKGAGGGVDVMGVLTSFATALRANDIDGIRAAITGLDTSMNQVTSARAKSGASLGALETAQFVNLAARDGERESAAQLGDADIIEAASKLALANHALEASLAATTQVFQLSLLNKLR